MKKIFAALLIIASLFTLAACKPEGDPVTDGSATIGDFNNAISATTPTSVTIKTTYENTAPAVTLNGEYNVTYNADGTATVAYKYDKLNSIGAADMTEEKVGAVNILANGTTTGDLDATVTAAAISKINLDEKKMTYSISMGALDATVKADDTKAIFGIDLGSDARLIMRITGDGKIGSYSINYSTPAGKAGIVCIYN